MKVLLWFWERWREKRDALPYWGTYEKEVVGKVLVSLLLT